MITTAVQIQPWFAILSFSPDMQISGHRHIDAEAFM